MAGVLKRSLRQLPPVQARLRAARIAFRDPHALRAQRRYAGAFLLNTMRKSGSHYLMSIVANFLWLEMLDGRERLDFVAMKDVLWNQPPDTPNVRRLRELTGYSRWVWEHENPLIRFNNARTIVHTYRNPLDTLVSRWQYLYVNRTSERDVDLDRAIESEVPPFAWHYVAVRSIASRPNVHRIAYERLVRDPVNEAADLLRFIGLQPSDDVVAQAVDASSRERVVDDERRHGLKQGNLVGGAAASFIRSGEVGEWRSYLDARQVNRIEDLLTEQGIALAEFVLD